MLKDPSFWTAIAFLGFVLVLLYVKIPALITKLLDDRADAIRTELEEARSLREQAQSVLADYERRQRQAEKEAEDIIVQAKTEAERLAEETQVKLEASLERRTKLAEDKIAQAEVQALKEVRIQAAEIAIAAAGTLIANEFPAKEASALVDASIKDLKKSLN
jgi:F-type H+-transporting ATPase subunit b